MRGTTQVGMLAVCPAMLLAAFAAFAPQGAATKPAAAPKQAAPKISQAAQLCIGCHQATTPGIIKDWKASKHLAAGTDCVTCHTAAGKGNRPDIQDHYGTKIVVQVTPKDCQVCHKREATEFMASRHADAAKFIGSLDNYLGEVVGGRPVAIAGCEQCHGSTTAMKGKTLDPATWPNMGVGRINLDGSKGTCTACHSRHIFSIAQARTPETCGKCHLGPDHPQQEVWNESKHGSRYHQALALGQSQGLKELAGKWLPGESYSAGPTCASCHISATPDQPTTHEVGARISWTLRPVISTKQPDWEKKRTAMQGVCMRCHSKSYVDSFYTQFDGVVNLYNNKFATPAKTIMDRLTESGKLTKTPFDAKIKWTYYELWHHEGRRARHGAAMSGPDYAWWHGIYDVAKVFYTEFLPEARQLDPALVDEVVGKMPEHDWFSKGVKPEEMKEIVEFYKTRYGQ